MSIIRPTSTEAVFWFVSIMVASVIITWAVTSEHTAQEVPVKPVINTLDPVPPKLTLDRTEYRLLRVTLDFEGGAVEVMLDGKYDNRFYQIPAARDDMMPFADAVLERYFEEGNDGRDQ